MCPPVGLARLPQGPSLFYSSDVLLHVENEGDLRPNFALLPPVPPTVKIWGGMGKMSQSFFVLDLGLNLRHTFGRGRFTVRETSGPLKVIKKEAVKHKAFLTIVWQPNNRRCVC